MQHTGEQVPDCMLVTEPCARGFRKDVHGLSVAFEVATVLGPRTIASASETRSSTRLRDATWPSLVVQLTRSWRSNTHTPI